MMQQDPALGREQSPVRRMKPEEAMDSRAKVVFKLDGECKGPTLLFGEFNDWQGEVMPDRVIYAGMQSVGSEIVKKLPPGVYQYYFEREGKRQVRYRTPPGEVLVLHLHQSNKEVGSFYTVTVG